MRLNNVSLLCALLLFYSSVSAEPDALQLSVDNSVLVELRWDSIEGDNEWLQGRRPVKKEGQYTVTIDAGKSIELLQSSQSWLRLISTVTLDWQQAIAVEQSTDGQLFIQKKLTTADQQQALLKPIIQTSVVRLQNVSEKSITISLYRSREFMSVPLMKYSHRLSLPTANEIDLQIFPDEGLQRYYQLNSMQSSNLEINGPTRLEIILRRPLTTVTEPATQSQLSLSLDNKIVESYDLQFEEDYHHTFRIKGKRVIVSDASKIYLNIPEGKHQLSLQSASHLYIQLRAMQRQYWTAQNLPDGIQKYNDPQNVRLSDPDLLKREKRVLNRLKNNAQKDDAIFVLAEMRKQIQQAGKKSWSQLQLLIELENRIKKYYTYFKPVLLAASDDVSDVYQHRWIRYRKNQLQMSRGVSETYLAKKFYQPRLAQVAEQGFHLLTDRKMQYKVTAFDVDSEMQVLVYFSDISSQKIWLQQDDHPPQLIRLRDLPSVKDKIRYTVTQKILDSLPCCESLLGGLAIDKGGVEMHKVASLQLVLNAGVRSVKVWQQSDAKPLWFALQQRRGKTYKLSESQYLYQLNQLNAFDKFVSGLNTYQKNQNTAHNINYSVLENHWLPLYKKFDDNYKNYLKNIKSLEFYNLNNPSDLNSQKVRLNALQAEGKRQWVLALQYWSQLWVQSSGEIQQTALHHMVINLHRSGQHALAKQLQLSIIFSPYKILPKLRDVTLLSPLFVQSQLDLLLKEFNSHGNKQADGDAKIALLSAYFVHHPDIKNLKYLARIMIEEGRYYDGLQLLLLLPQELRPQQLILLSALDIGWSEVFDRALSDTGLSDSQINKWRGLQALFSHDYAVAEKYLSAVGIEDSSDVKNWLLLLRESKLIRNDLLSGDINLRQQSIYKWQNLQSRINKTVISGWRNENISVLSHAGQVELIKPTTQIKLMHYLSRPQQPLKLKIAGPVKLILQIRPIHKIITAQVKALSSVYFIDDNNLQRSYLINQNFPANNWRISRAIAGREQSELFDIPGQRVLQEIDLGPGLHQLSIAGKDDLLIRIQRQHSLLPVSALPQLTVKNMSRVLQTDLSVTGRHLTVNTHAYLKSPEEEATNEVSLLSTDQRAAVKNLQTLQKLTLQLETPITNKEELISLAEKIYANSDNDKELSATMARLRRFSRWDLLNSIEQSDGFWIQEYEKYNPESPQSRIYKSLLAEQPHPDDLLRNASKQVVSVFYPIKSQFVFEFRSVSPLFMRTQNIHMSYQVDDGEVQNIVVSARQERISIPLSAGQHSIKINVLQAALHHRLWIKFESRNGQSVSDNKFRRYNLASQNQALVYNLHGPVWLRIDKLINKNIENNFIESTYRYLPDGDHQLKLMPDQNESSAYFRVFIRNESQTLVAEQYLNWADSSSKVDNNIVTRNIRDNILITEMSPNNSSSEKNLLANKTPEQQMDFYFKDGWKLGRQQSGTTSLLLTRVDQNLIIDELEVSSDQYLETELAYRKHNSISKYIHGRWFYLAGLARVREEGNTSIGVKSRLRGKFNVVPIDWTIDGRAYAQQINSTTETSFQFQLRLSQTRWLGSQFYHLPKMDFFARWLSANSDGGNTNIDRDVYSDYKKDHPSGFRVSETFVYRPYQDMEFYTGLTLVSNANWVELDQYRSRVGARVQWGDVRWDINARNLQFIADDDRAQDSSRSVIQARILVEKWFFPRYRFELAAALDHDVDSGDDTVRVQLSVHQSEGRGYLDYSPAETLFRNVRQSKLNPGLNNEFN